MFLRELSQSVTVLKGAGPQVSGKLARLGVYTVADIILYYPRDYDDRRSLAPFSSFAREPRVRTVAEVLSHEWFGYGRMKTLKVRVRDETAEAVLVCFNRPFLENQLPVGERVALTGKFSYRYGELQSSSFEIERLGEGGAPVSAILPLYPLTEGLDQGRLRRMIKAALVEYGAKLEEELPEALREKRSLMPKRSALRAVHFPKDSEELAAARASLIFEELFYFQIAVARRAMRRREIQVERRAPSGVLKRRLIERLPFELTKDQLSAAAEIEADMAEPRPMARLLQGDVGSGKTLVAFLACLGAIEAGGQAAIMAPTELLARQHAATAARLLEPLGVRLAFLSGNVEDRARPPLLAALKAGEVDLVLGTQAPLLRRGRVQGAEAGRRRRAAPLRRPAAGGALAQGPRARPPHDDGDAHPTHAGPHRLRRPLGLVHTQHAAGAARASSPTSRAWATRPRSTTSCADSSRPGGRPISSILSSASLRAPPPPARS